MPAVDSNAVSDVEESSKPTTTGPAESSTVAQLKKLEPKADVTIEPLEIDLGILRSAAIVPIELKLTNHGSRSLTIRRMDTGCKCVKATAEKLPGIGGGETVALHLTLNPVEKGVRAYKIRVSFDDFQVLPVVATVRMATIPPMHSRPAVVDLGTVKRGDSARQEFVVYYEWPSETEPAKTEFILPLKPRMTLELREPTITPDSSRSRKVEIPAVLTLDTTVPPTRFSTWIRFKGESHKNYDLSITGEITDGAGPESPEKQ